MFVSNFSDILQIFGLQSESYFPWLLSLMACRFSRFFLIVILAEEH